MIDIFRAALARSAVWNTLILALAVQGISVPVAVLLTQWAGRWPRSLGWRGVCIAWPLLLDIWGWSALASAIPLWVSEPTTALAFLLLAYSLRLLPFSLAILSLYQGHWQQTNPPAQQDNHWFWQASLFVILVNLWHVVVNTTIPLFITGGRPFHTTYLLSSWSFHLLWVNGDWGSAMVMALPLVIGTALLVVIMTWLSGNHQDSLAQPAGKHWAVLAVALLLALWPYGFLLATGLLRRTSFLDARWLLWLSEFANISLLVWWVGERIRKL